MGKTKRITYKSDPENRLIKFFVNSELKATWLYENSLREALDEFKLFYNMLFETIKQNASNWKSGKLVFAIDNDQQNHLYPYPAGMDLETLDHDCEVSQKIANDFIENMVRAGATIRNQK